MVYGLKFMEGETMAGPVVMEPDWGAIRRDFPILDQEIGGHPLLYFDNAATSQKPRAVIDAISGYYLRDNSNVHRGIHTLSNRATDAFEHARGLVARWINAPGEGVLFTRGTTEAVNLVARAWGDTHVGAGDVILLTEMEHHSNLVPWQMLAERSGASLRFVPVDETGCLVTDDLESLLEGAKIFALTHVSNSLGTINPVAELCRRAAAAGVATLVDAAQSAGHMPVDMQAIGCDFLVFSGHKMCGPTGIGILAGRPGVLNAMPPYEGGGEMIAEAWYARSDYKEAPWRFEAGTPPIAEAVGLGAAVTYLGAIGREAIVAHDRALTAAAVAELSSIPGLGILGPAGERAALVSFTLEGAHAHDIVTLADQYGLALRGGHHCTQPLHRKFGLSASARASFYFYNTHEEIAAMGRILRKIRDILG
jgi:cysteine desulfurase / selenocysteine lyase